MEEFIAFPSSTVREAMGRIEKKQEGIVVCNRLREKAHWFFKRW